MATPRRRREPRTGLLRRATTIALALPATLLAIGWFLASLHADSAQHAQQVRELGSSAEVVAAAVRQGLEELRAREDERPYYLYSYYYTPQDLIAVEESVAVSPLGRVPDDARERGHFQIDPGPRVTSPLVDREAPPVSRARGEQVVREVTEHLAPRLAALVHAPPAELQQRANQAIASSFSNAVQNQNSYYGSVLADIRAAQSGQLLARDRLSDRGRAPMRTRVPMPWSASANVQSDPSANDGDLATDAPRGDVTANALNEGDNGAYQRAGDVGGRPAGVGEPGVAGYTPMAYRREDGALILYRVVSTEGAASVQGVLLDGEVLRGRWLRGVARRNVMAHVATTSIEPLSRAEAGACPAWAPLPSPLDDLAVCAHPAHAWSDRRALRWQLLALAAVLALITASTIARGRALRRAEELAGIERAFVASVSHELRTPLTTLRMHAEMLKEGWVSEARRERVIDQLVDESGRLSRLVEDVLTFGRLADGRAELAVEDGDLAASARAVVERERPRLEARGVQLDALGAQVEVRARFDATALDQVLTNLLDNAAKYAAGATDRTVRVAVQRRGTRTVLRVDDRGPGVAASERTKVFERFYRGRSAVASHVAGTGLGLAIVRGLARAMGGDARIVDSISGCAIEIELASSDDPLV